MARRTQSTANNTPATLKQTTRERLVAAAHELIWANSYAHVSVEEICRAAGVQKGSFYHFFPTKADLAAAAMEEHFAESCPEFDAIFELKTAEAQIRGFAKLMHDIQAESLATTGMVCGCPFATLGAEMRGNNTQLQAMSEKLMHEFSDYYERLLDLVVAEKHLTPSDVKTRAAEMHTYTLGAMLQARMTNRLDYVGKPLELALLRISGLAGSAAMHKTPVKLVKKR